MVTDLWVRKSRRDLKAVFEMEIVEGWRLSFECDKEQNASIKVVLLVCVT